MNILVAYAATTAPLRTAVADHLYAFERYSGSRCFHVNLAVRRVPRLLHTVPIDLVVYHTTLVGARWSPRWFRRLMNRAAVLDAIDAPKIALPQDEYYGTELLNQFLVRRGVGHVFSCAYESEWEKIYPGLADCGVSFATVLTGYLTDQTLAEVRRLEGLEPDRSLHVSYRAQLAPMCRGRHAHLKTAIADVFLERCASAGLPADISTRRADTLYGDDWYRMLLRSRWVIGVEGGASVLDRDGSIRARTEEYLRRHPRASFEDVEAACFPGLDDTINYSALSPRHLEACATRTGQILVEGHYNGVLEAGRHYLALKPDFSNIDEVLEQSRDEDLRQRMVTAAYQDIVLSRRYSYGAFVEQVISQALPSINQPPSRSALTRVQSIVSTQLTISDRLSWPRVRVLRLGINGARRLERRVRQLRSRRRAAWTAVRP